MAETRKDKRAPISLKVRFKSATLDEFIEQYSGDISRGGIFIKSKKPMTVGTLLKFEFQLKDESRLIHGVGRVVWRRETSKGKDMPPGMGIKFIKMDPDSRSLVQRIVAERGSVEGRFEQGPDGPEETASPFFPSTTPQSELPSPEDRTQVRHASEFLASALADSKVDSAAAKEAEKKAEEARKRTEQIEKERAKKRKEAAERAKRMARGEAERKKALAKGIEDNKDEEEKAKKPEPPAKKPEPPAKKPEPPAPPKKAEAKKPAPPAPPKKAEANKEIDAPPVFDEEGPTQLRPSSEAIADIEKDLIAKELEKEKAEAEKKEEAKKEEKKAVAPAPEPEKKEEKKEEAKKPEPKKPEPKAAAKKAEPKKVEKPAPKAKPADEEERPAWMMPAIGVAIAAVALIAFFVFNNNGGGETTTTNNPPVESGEGTEGEGAEGEGTEGEGLEGEGAEGEGEAAEVSFRVASTPAGATISVDGNEVGTAPVRVTGHVGQEMQIVATLSGHSAASQRLTPSAGQAEQRLTLAALPYHINVTTDPAGAEVRAEGETVTSPGRIVLSSAPTRAVSISARLDGYRTERERVSMDDFHQDGETMVASISLSLSRSGGSSSGGSSSGSSSSGSSSSGSSSSGSSSGGSSSGSSSSGSSSGGSSSGGSSSGGSSSGGSSSGGSSSGGSSSGGSSGGSTGTAPPENPF